MEIIIAVLTTFLGLFLYERAKRKSAEGALNNIEVKKDVLKVEQQTSKNSGLLEAEEEKREQIKNDKSNLSLEEIARYFNDPNNNNTKH